MTQDWKVSGHSITLPKVFEESALLDLASLYNFRFGIVQHGLPDMLGCTSSKSVANLYHEFEYYTFPTDDVPRRLGQLARGRKDSKKARQAATMAIRIHLWSNPSRMDKAGNCIEEGKVRFYDPLSKQLQKQSVAEAARWIRTFLRPLREDWRKKMTSANRELNDIYRATSKTTEAEILFIEHMRRVWYLLHVTEAPLQMIHEVVWLESNMATCKRILDEVKGEDLDDFNFRHLLALYS